MRVHKAPSEGSSTSRLNGHDLAPEVLERAVSGLSWTCAICAATSLAFTVIQYLLQPEFALAWTHPLLRAASAGVVIASLGCLSIQRLGWLTKYQLLDLGIVFQVTIAFAAGLLEGSIGRAPDTAVVGLSGIAVWMMLCARMMPKPPLKSALASVLCVGMWPLAYSVDIAVLRLDPMPQHRMLAWILPLSVVAIWTHVVNNRTLRLYVQQQRAEEIGSYVLHKLIDRGGMGEVWLAKHRTLARDAALKLIRPEVLHSNSGRRESLLRKRFEREAQATASLRCPHTVALYDFGLSKDGAFYYVMELIHGIDLQTLVRRYGPLDPSRVVHILCQVSQSLEEAHQSGLVHRDIKPRNILLGRLGLEYDFAKVLDFGLVKSLRPDGVESTATVDGSAIGTPAYMPLEMALGSSSVDGRADLYSLGCTAYFLLTGKTVFDAPNAATFAIAHVSAPVPPMSSRTELTIPLSLDEIIMHLLQKDPAKRISSAKELRHRLLNLPDVPAWPAEAAERWWATHMPGAALDSQSSPTETETFERLCA